MDYNRSGQKHYHHTVPARILRITAMFKRLVIFILRCKYGLKRGQCFKFDNQKKDVLYFFGRDRLWKMVPENFDYESIRYAGPPLFAESNVSLNWLLDDRCSIRKVDVPWLALT